MPLTLVFILVGLLGLTLAWRGWRGQVIDDHPCCARCAFDLVGHPEAAAACPECGADIRQPRAIRIGQRRRRPRLVALGALLLLVACGSAGLRLWAGSRGVNWNQYKPQWWLSTEMLHASEPTARAAAGELSLRATSGKLSASNVTRALDSMLSAVDRGRAASIGPALAELIAGATLEAGARQRLIEGVLSWQSDRSKPWSIEVAGAFQNECLAGHLPHEVLERFLQQSCHPRLSLVARGPVRPGQVVAVMLATDFRGALAHTEVTCPIPGLTPGPGLPYWNLSFGPSAIYLGTITAPERPGTYSLSTTVKLCYSPEKTAPGGGPVPFVGSRFLSMSREASADFPISVEYSVAEQAVADPYRDLASSIFWTDVATLDAQLGRTTMGCSLWSVYPRWPVSATFSASWRYDGSEIEVGHGSFEATGTKSSYSWSWSGGSAGGSSTRSTGEGPPEPQTYNVATPVGATGPSRRSSSTSRPWHSMGRETFLSSRSILSSACPWSGDYRPHSGHAAPAASPARL